MLENDDSDATQFLIQLESASVAPWRCPCGCASIDLLIAGHTKPKSGTHPLADFIFGIDEDLNGIFVYEMGGVLAGVEVYGMAGEAAKSLPQPESLRPFA
jgi:hypothetical protein